MQRSWTRTCSSSSGRRSATTRSSPRRWPSVTKCRPSTGPEQNAHGASTCSTCRSARMRTNRSCWPAIWRRSASHGPASCTTAPPSAADICSSSRRRRKSSGSASPRRLLWRPSRRTPPPNLAKCSTQMWTHLFILGLGLSAPALTQAVTACGWAGPCAMNTAGLRGYAPEFGRIIDGWVYVDMHSDRNTTLAALRQRLAVPAAGSLAAAKGYDLGRLVAEGSARAPERTRGGVKDGLEQVKWLAGRRRPRGNAAWLRPSRPRRPARSLSRAAPVARRSISRVPSRIAWVSLTKARSRKILVGSSLRRSAS